MNEGINSQYWPIFQKIGLTINYDQPNPTSDLVLDIFITIGTYLQYNEYYSQTLSDQSPESSSRNK